MNAFTDASAIAQIKQKLTQRLNKRGQRGVTLVELSVAVAVMGLIMAGAMVGVPRLMNSVKLTQEMKDWQASMIAVQNGVISGTLDSTTDETKMMKLAVTEPFNRTEGGSKLINRFGGPITITAIASGTKYPSNGVTVTSGGYPSAQCQEFAGKMANSFATLSINSEVIKSDKVNDLTKIATACTNKGSDVVTTADLEFTIAG